MGLNVECLLTHNNNAKIKWPQLCNLCKILFVHKFFNSIQKFWTQIDWSLSKPYFLDILSFFTICLGNTQLKVSESTPNKIRNGRVHISYKSLKYEYLNYNVYEISRLFLEINILLLGDHQRWHMLCLYIRFKV